MKPGLKFEIGDITDKGTVMDITESWKPEIYKQPLYYVTHTPEKYKKSLSCGIWKLGEELTLSSVMIKIAEIQMDCAAIFSIIPKGTLFELNTTREYNKSGKYINKTLGYSFDRDLVENNNKWFKIINNCPVS